MKRLEFHKTNDQYLFIPAVGLVKLSDKYKFKRGITFTFLNYTICFFYRLRKNKNEFKFPHSPYDGKRFKITIDYCGFSLIPAFGMRLLPLWVGYKYSLCFAWGHLYMCYRIGKYRLKEGNE